MIDFDLADYISKSLRRGITWEETRNSLLGSGYSDVDINEAVNYLNRQPKKLPEYNYSEFKPSSFFVALKWVFFGIFMIGLIIALFFIFGKVFSSVGSNVINIDNDAIIAGSSFELKRNSVVSFEFDGKDFNLQVKEAFGVYNFKDDSISFVVSVGESRDVDLNFDGIADFTFSLKGVEPTVVSISEIVVCSEDWSCTDWSPCISGSRKRVCTDSNGCHTSDLKPVENEDCSLNSDFSVTTEGYNQTVVLNESNSSS